MQYPDWTDKFELYHTDPFPDPTQSENSPLFSAYVLAFKIMTQPHLKAEVKKEAQLILETLKSSTFFNKYATAIVEQRGWDKDDLSHDNYKGIAVLHFLAEEPLPLWLSFRAHWRPDNFMIALYCIFVTNIKFNKDPERVMLYPLVLLLFPAVLSVLAIGFLYMVLAKLKTNVRHYKTRNGVKIPVTDGKLLSLMLFQTWGWGLMTKLATKLIQRNKLFGSWYAVSTQYFKFKEHPVNRLLKEWES